MTVGRKAKPDAAPPPGGEDDLSAEAAEEVCSDGAFSVKGAAAFTGLDESMVRKLLVRGEVPRFNAGVNVMIPKRALVRWMADRLREAVARKD